MRLKDVSQKDIETNVEKSALAQRLAEQKERGIIGGEHWFRKAELWQRITATANPYFTVYSELFLLKDKQVQELAQNHTFVFYGVGTGDTEIGLVKPEIERRGYVEVVGIDVNRDFLEIFAQSLSNLNGKNVLMYKGYHDLFQNVRPEYFNFENSWNDAKMFVSLGNTIGNFEEDTVFNLFANQCDASDRLLVGFQLAQDVESILKHYSENPVFDHFLKKSLRLGNRRLKWRFNKEKSQIEAWYGELLVFHSKKFLPQAVSEFARKSGFSLLHQVKDHIACVQAYEYEATA